MLTGAQKAIAAMIITTIGGILTVLATQLPLDHTIALTAAIGTGVLTVVANVLGVYQTRNGAAAPAVPAPQVKAEDRLS